ncbi:MAG TPA: tetratricopeptide repeat protein [Pyrinomonadaceae bacterium]|nr:tetratricopeptide repeat protein [Pyrinomonadaceae bacterium]
MLDPKSPEENNTTRRRRALRLMTCLALVVVCFATAVSGQSPRPARESSAQPEKTGAAKATRSRRVADKADARTQTVPPAPAVKRAQAEDSARADEPSATEPDTPGEPKAKGEPNESASKVAPAPPSAEEEIEKLRAELRAADAESRPRLRRALVDRLVALDRKPDALSELRLMIHEDRFDPVFFFNTGNALARLGDATAAADAYRKAVSQRRGNYARALNNLGVVLTRQGRWDEAHDALTAALTQENLLYAEASYNLGRLHLLRGETNLALREWGRTLRLQPDHADAAAALARALAEDGDEKRAAAVLANFTARAARTGATVPRQIAYAREAIAASRADSREDSRAQGADNAAGPRAPRADASRFDLDASTHRVFQSAREAGERGRHEEAARQYQRVLKQSGGYFAPANLELGFAMMNLKRWYDAISALQPVAERDSARFPVAHYHLARVYERLGRHTTAGEHFARAAELYGDANPQMLVDLSRVRETAGDTRGALEAIEAYSVAIAGQGSVPGWVTERADSLRMKLKGGQTTQPAKQ